MRQFDLYVAGSLLFAGAIGCGLHPAPSQTAGEGGSAATGTGGSSTGRGGSTSSGAGGVTGSGGVSVTGNGGGGGDVGPEIDASTSCGQTNVSVMPEPRTS